MKKAILPAICILISTLLAALMPTEAEAAIYEDTVRLHILAPSDEARDQELKIAIRDKLLQKYSGELSASGDATSAKKRIRGSIEEIEADCQRWVSEAGFDYSARAELCEEWYETREYRDFTLPAGCYASLKITLGEGAGQNWWCVMYPPLCLDLALGGYDEFSDAEYNLISESGYNVKFKLLELSSSVFGRKKSKG